MIHERIKQVIELSGLTMTEFADLLKVQRSSISHLISGRNKPSMDFLEKLVEHFPNIDLKWLISGGSSLPVEVESSTAQKQEKKIKQIIVWYTDNSFEVIKELG
jgi:transcriptional regulator with XRE-family HTH domain